MTEERSPSRTDNNPPDPIDDRIEALLEAAKAFDGTEITADNVDEAQTAINGLKDVIKDTASRRLAEVDPLHQAHKAAVAKWAPMVKEQDELKRRLLRAVDTFHREEERKAAQAAEEARQAAEEEVEPEEWNRAEQEAQQATAKAEEKAEKAKENTRTFWHAEVKDGCHGETLQWIARNDKTALHAFISEYVRKAGKSATEGPNPIAGVFLRKEVRRV